MRKLKIYLDTSVLNFYYAEDSPKEMLATQKLFEEIKKGKYETFISDVVIDEIDKADGNIKNKLKNLLLQYPIKTLKIGEEVRELFERYLQMEIIPEKFANDMLHIAVAVVNEIDILLSWNYAHILKLRTKNEVNGVNLLLGYKQIQICSPLEVVENED